MRLHSFFFALLSFFTLQITFAQTGDVRGVLTDKASGEPINYATVYLEGTSYGSITNLDGFYSINRIPEGEYTLMATFVGYDTTRVDIVIQDGSVLNQPLVIREGIQLDAVEVSRERDEKVNQVKASSIEISAKQINKIPTIGGEPDLAQYLQVLPGVVFTGDQGGQLYIRGGSLIQTKVLLDGIRVYNPFHSIGLFSVFETSLIKNVEVLTGGFGAEYGGAISAIIDIKTRDGNKKKVSGRVGANTFLAKAMVEGPIVKLKEESEFSASYMLAAKTSYLDASSKLLYGYVTDLTNNEGLADSDDVLPYTFTDIYGKVSLAAENGTKLNFSGYRYDDQANFMGASLFDWTNWGVGGTFVLVPRQSKIIMDGHFGYSQYDLSLSETTIENDVKPRTSSIGGFDFGVNFSYFLPKGLIKYGIEVAGFSTTFNFFNPLGIKIDEDQNTTELAFFFNYRGNFGKLVIEPSIRFNYYASLSAARLEPRIGGKYNATDFLRFKFAGGLYSQNFISTKSDRDVVNLFTGFLSAPEGSLRTIDGEKARNNIQTALHGIAGVEVDLTRRLSLNTEVYYKGFTQLININREKLFPTDPNYIIEEGQAYGIDFLLKYDYKNWFIWGVYSLAYVERNDGNQTYAPHFDRRHNLNFLASYNFGRNLDWEVSARWNLGSGFPFTQTQGFFEQLSFLGGIDVNILEQNGDLGIIYADELNGGRLPTYHRFDLSIKKIWALGADAKLEATASVTNVYNRENIFYVNRVTLDKLNQLPVLPSMGVTFSF